MSRAVLFLSILFLVTAGVFGQSENVVRDVEDDDDCLVYEEEVHFLDPLQRPSDLGVQKLDSLPDYPPFGFDYTTRSPTPGKYDGFELLDHLYGPTEPVVLLDTLSPVEEDPEIELFSPISTTARTNDQVQQKVVNKYDDFELLDKLKLIRKEQIEKFGPLPTPAPTHAVEPVRDHSKVPDRSTFVLPWKGAPNAQDQISDKFSDSKAFRGLYDVAPLTTPAPTYSVSPIQSHPKVHDYKSPGLSSTFAPKAKDLILDQFEDAEAFRGLYEVVPLTTPAPTYSLEPVRDHLKGSDRSTLVLPWKGAPNVVDRISDQFQDSGTFRGLYDVAPALAARTEQPTTYKPPPHSTTFFPRTRKTYAVEPVRDHLQVPDRSTYVLPWKVAPNVEARILDQFEDSEAFRGLYEVAPLTTTHPTNPENMRPFVPVIDEFVTDDVTYSYVPRTPGPKPLAPVLDQFATNDVIYPRLKRATESSDELKPKRKCLKRRPKTVTNPAKAEVAPMSESSSHSIQSNREVSIRCSGQRLSALIPIGHCKKFYVRCDQEPKLMMCTRRSEVFSKTSYGCVPKSEAPECPSFVMARPISATLPLVQNGTMENFCQLRADGFYRHFGDCTRVIQCFDGDAFEYPPCPKKLVFDEKRGQCEYKRNVPGC